MEAALGVRYNHRHEISGERAVVRYADDFVVFCQSQEDALLVRDKLLPPWLAERGLCLSKEKTRIVHLTEGFDFLGYHVRHFKAPRTTRTGHKLIIRPSKKSVLNKRKELREAWLTLKGQSVPAVLRRLNPIVRGWANYYRSSAASEAFQRMDSWMFQRAKRYAKRTHPRKPWKWIKARYWGQLNAERNDRWVFGDKRSGAYLLKFRWLKIVRHAMVRGTASPDDPDLREYWWERRKVNIRHLTAGDVELANDQDWVCRLCGMDLINGEELHRHHKAPRAAGGSELRSNRELVHLYCHQQETKRQFAGNKLRQRPADEGPD
jgi:RNA-directed DNA polymerase